MSDAKPTPEPPHVTAMEAAKAALNRLESPEGSAGRELDPQAVAQAKQRVDREQKEALANGLDLPVELRNFVLTRATRVVGAQQGLTKEQRQLAFSIVRELRRDPAFKSKAGELIRDAVNTAFTNNA